MPATLEAPTEANPFADLIPKAQTDYGQFSDLVPSGLKAGVSVAGQEDYGLFSDLVPKSPTSETEKVVADTPVIDKAILDAEKSVPPFHQAMNAARSLAAGAGKYIFDGLQGLEQNVGKYLEDTATSAEQRADYLVLPDGSSLSKDQQVALEKQYHDNAVAQIPDAKAKADLFKQLATNTDTAMYVDPELANTIPARIAHAAGSAGVMALESVIPRVGVPFMVAHGAMATEAEAKNAGKTDAEAETAGVRSAIGLALFGGASKLAALGVAKLLPDGASSVRKFLTQFIGQEAANETSSRAINAWEKASDAPEGKKIEAALNALKDTTLEQSTLNTVYALAHATKAGERAPVRPEAAPEPSAPLKTAEIPPATTGEPQAPATEVLKSEPQPTGEENGTLSQRSAETQIPRPTETGENQPISSEGMGRSEQGAETAGTPQTQKEPIGVADAIAEIQRRNAPSPVQHGEFPQEGYTAMDSPTQPGDPPVSGISNERLNQIYGEDAVTAGKGKGPKEWQRIGQADTRDPYAVLSKAQKQGFAPPEDVALFRAEHQRLLQAARDAYGTPQYEELAQRAANMANATKGVAHGPASDVMRALQEVDKPRYDSAADFDSIIRERMNRESTPQEKNTFSKVADELRNGDQEAKVSADEAQKRLARYKPKEVVSFEDAVKHVRGKIEKLTEACVL